MTFTFIFFSFPASAACIASDWFLVTLLVESRGLPKSSGDSGSDFFIVRTKLTTLGSINQT
jgi:hypothetical protein